MCTIMTISRDVYQAHTTAVVARITSDATNNPHGCALVLVGKDGTETVLRTMDTSLITAMLAAVSWERMFLHFRWATQGATGISNTHGWQSKRGVFVMHNGTLNNPDAGLQPVDSMLIVDWLERGGVAHAVEHLAGEDFANVFLIDTQGDEYTVSRSVGGALYTDGHGNYSSNPVGEITHAVPPGADYRAMSGELIYSDRDPEDLPGMHAWDEYTASELIDWKLRRA